MCVCLMVSLRKCVYCSQATDVENRYHNCVNEYGTILFTVAAKERRLKSIWYGSFSLVRQKRQRDSVPIMRTRERHLFFLQKTIELSNWLDKISFRAAPPTEICCLYSQVIFYTFEEVYRLIKKIWLAVRRLIAILSLAGPPRDPKISFRSL